MLRAAFRSLLGRKLRLVMSTSAIVLGVAFVAGTLIFTDTLNRSFTALFASTVGDVVVRPVGATTEDGSPSTVTIPASTVDDLGDVEGAARVDGNVISFGVFVIGEDGKVVGGQGPPGLAGNYTTAPAGHGIVGLQVTDGRAPRGPEEVVLDADTMEAAGYRIGDEVRLVSAGRQALLTPTLVGSTDFVDGGSLNGASMAMFETRTAQDLFLDGVQGFNDIWVTADSGVSQEELRETVAAQLPDGLEAVTGDDAADENASDLLEAISFLTYFLLIFAGISLVVGSFLIVNTFSILVAQRSRELALLRALGASTRQVTGSVLFEALVLGVLGSTVGLGLGVLLAMGIRALFANFGLDLSGSEMVFAPRTVLASYAVGVVVTTAAAWLPARRTSRIPPVAAMRDEVAMPESSLRRRMLAGCVLIVAGGAAMLAGLYAAVPEPGWFVGGGILAVLLGVASASPVLARPFLVGSRWGYARAFGAVGNLAGQNALRNPRRTAATASALMIGLALVCTMSIVGSSAKASVDQTIEKNFVGDYVVSNLLGSSFSPTVADRIAEVEGVGTVVRTRFGLAEVEGERGGLTGVDPGNLAAGVRVTMVDGSLADLRKGTVMLSEQRAVEYGAGVGDTLQVQVPTGAKAYPVVGIYEENPVLGFGRVTTLDTLVDAGFQDADNFLVISTDGTVDPTAMQGRLDEVVAELPTVTVKDQAGFAAEQRAPIDQMLLLIYALLALALVIAVLGIINTLALSIVERTREVGLLRAIGVTRGQMRQMVGLESVVIAVLGALLGVAMGVVFGVTLMVSLKDQGLEVIDVPTLQLLVFLGLAVVIGVLAAVLPARRAARLDVLRAIATE